MQSPILDKVTRNITIITGAAVVCAAIGIGSFVHLIKVVPESFDLASRNYETVQKLTSDTAQLAGLAPRYDSVREKFGLGTLNGAVRDTNDQLDRTLTELSSQKVIGPDEALIINGARNALGQSLDSLNRLVSDRLHLERLVDEKYAELNEFDTLIRCHEMEQHIKRNIDPCQDVGPLGDISDNVVIDWLAALGTLVKDVRLVRNSKTRAQFALAMRKVRKSIASAEELRKSIPLQPDTSPELIAVRFNDIFLGEGNLIALATQSFENNARIQGVINQSNVDASQLISAVTSAVRSVRTQIDDRNTALLEDLEALAVLLLVLVFICLVIAILAFLDIKNRVIKRIIDLKTAVDHAIDGKTDTSFKTEMTDEIGELSRAYGFFLDEIREREARLREQRDDATELARAAETANVAKSMFLSGMSHELRTPLNAIIGFSEAITETDVSQEKQKEYISDIHDSGKHLLSIINDILEFSKIEAGRIELDFTEIRSFELIERSILFVKLSARQRDIALKVEGTDIVFKADEMAALRVLVNILTNAVKFSRRNSEIVITSSLSADGTMIVLSVQDHGVGIAQSALGTILEPFRQEVDLYINTSGGTGLGLSIVKNLVELHDGSIDIESEKGVGTTVTVRLPIDNVGTAAKDAKAAE